MTHIRRELAIAGDRATARLAVRSWTMHYRREGAGATVLPTAGYWEGAEEDGVVVRFDWPANDHDTGAVLWRGLVEALAVSLPLERFGHYTAHRIAFAELDLQAIVDNTPEALPELGRSV